MIISASRRTDIPAFYARWMINRIKEKYVLVRNPWNFHQISRIDLSPDVVDGIVFWTKNPAPMLRYLPELQDYNYYFQFTLNSYGNDVEINLPRKNGSIINTFRKLSERIGRERVIWRYDPILFNDFYTVDYHTKYFGALAKKLGDYTAKCTVSFIDYYKCTESNMKQLGMQEKSQEQKYELMKEFADIGREYGFYIDTCAENMNLEKLGINHACCIDKSLLEKIGNFKLKVAKDANQREECGCVDSIDIGAYNTCLNGCLYCYANYNTEIAKRNYQCHNPESPLLLGTVGENDIIHERKLTSCIDRQLSFGWME